MNLLRPRNRNFFTRVARRIHVAVGAACFLLLIPTTTRAGSTGTNDVSAKTASRSTNSGTITIDLTTGAVTTGEGGIIIDAGGSNPLPLVWSPVSTTDPASLDPIVDLSSSCVGCGGHKGQKGKEPSTSGTTLTVAVSEPAESLLLFTGLGALGILLVRRRRMTARA